MTATPDVPAPTETTREALVTSAARLHETLDGLVMSPDRWAAPSVLPGWRVAHVAAHLALNAEALAGVLAGAAKGQAVPMYASQEVRERDIDALATADPATVTERARTGAVAFDAAFAAMPEAAWSGTFERVPGVPPTSLGAVVPMRLREIEIHHADLALGYTSADWPADFTRALLVDSLAIQAGAGPFDVVETESGESWTVGGPGGARVFGTAADLTWWLLGRGTGQGLTCDGDLPVLGSWPRPAPR